MNQLEETGAVTTGKRGIRLTSKAKLPALVQRAVERSEARQRVDQSRLTMMRGYAGTDGCRRQFLLGYLGEDLPEPCSHCDACAAAAARRDAPQLETHTPDDGGPGFGGGAAPVAEQPFALQSTVVHKEWGQGLVMRHEERRDHSPFRAGRLQNPVPDRRHGA